MTDLCNDLKADDLEKSNESAINFDKCKDCEFNAMDVDRTACIECEKDYLVKKTYLKALFCFVKSLYPTFDENKTKLHKMSRGANKLVMLGHNREEIRLTKYSNGFYFGYNDKLDVLAYAYTGEK
jgi:hypothetical protein